ncbi:MAG: hypothetical protein IJ072_03365, partial [Oscillospiraceae bacterium]|nr:hypothetical protein [Oscillospiraceae bacterium]
MPSIKVAQTDCEAIYDAILRRVTCGLTEAEKPELFVVSPELIRQGYVPEGEAKIVLLPGFTERCHVRAVCAVTYGLSQR